MVGKTLSHYKVTEKIGQGDIEPHKNPISTKKSRD